MRATYTGKRRQRRLERALAALRVSRGPLFRSATRVARAFRINAGVLISVYLQTLSV